MTFLDQKLAPSQQAMLHHLRKRREVSRADLGELAGLSSGAVTRFGRQLIDLGLVQEQSATKASGPGRPTQSLVLRPEGGLGIGFAVHPGWVEAVCIDFTGAEVAHRRVAFDALTPAILAGIQKDFIATCSSAIKSVGHRVGIGLALPGYVTDRPGRRHTVAGLEAWRDIDVPSFLVDELGFPAFVENDASAAALAEFYAPGTEDNAVLMCLTLGPGVGGGIVANGQLTRGAHGNAGEIGWLYPYGEPRPSARDFRETLASAGDDRSLLAWVSADVSPDHEVIADWCARAGKQLTFAVNAGGGWIDPDRLVITGPLPLPVLEETARILAQQDLFEIEENISRPMPRGSSYGSKAAAIGAAHLVFHALSFGEPVA